MNTLKQQVSQQEAELAKIKEQEQLKNVSSNVLIGSMYISLAKQYPKYAKNMLADIENNITKKSELARLQWLIEELEPIAYPKGRLTVQNWDERSSFLRQHKL